MTAATFQTAINVQLNPGIVGEQDKYGPSRVTPRMLDSNGGYIGNYFTVNAKTGAASQGGVIGVSGQVVTVAGGFMIRPKEAVSYGAPGGTPLDPTLFVPGNRPAELLSMGFLWVANTNSAGANLGDFVSYNTTTGVIATYAPSASPASGFAQVPNAYVDRGQSASAGLVGIVLTN